MACKINPALELRMVFMFLNGWKENQNKNNLSCKLRKIQTSACIKLNCNAAMLIWSYFVYGLGFFAL